MCLEVLFQFDVRRNLLFLEIIRVFFFYCEKSIALKNFKVLITSCLWMKKSTRISSDYYFCCCFFLKCLDNKLMITVTINRGIRLIISFFDTHELHSYTKYFKHKSFQSVQTFQTIYWQSLLIFVEISLCIDSICIIDHQNCRTTIFVWQRLLFHGWAQPIGILNLLGSKQYVRRCFSVQVYNNQPLTRDN